MNPLPPKPLKLQSTYSLILEWQAWTELLAEHLGHAYQDEFERGLIEREAALSERLAGVVGLVGVGDDLAVRRLPDGTIEEVPLVPCRCIAIPPPAPLNRDDLWIRDSGLIVESQPATVRYVNGIATVLR